MSDAPWGNRTARDRQQRTGAIGVHVQQISESQEDSKEADIGLLASDISGHRKQRVVC
jgi:hypothetical protein